MKHKKSLIFIVFSFLLFSMSEACKNQEEPKKKEATETAPPAEHLNVPAFDADSAYVSVGIQAAMGPRTPGSEAQSKCATWMQDALRKVCDTVYRQQVHVKG